MTRAGTLVATIGAAGAFGALISGVPLLVAVPFVALALAGVGSGWVARRRVPDGTWASPVPLVATATAHEDRGSPPPWRVARALGRVEARELVLHPWIGAGIGLCTFMALGFGLGGTADGTWENELQDLTFLAHPLVGMAVLAGHAAAARSQRSGTGELFASCPASPSSRRLGVLAAMWVAPAVLAAFFATYITSTAISNPDLTSPLGPVALHIASGLTLGAGGVALGVAVGRWTRFALAPVVAIVVVGFVSLRLADGASGRFEPAMLLSTFPPVGAGDEAAATVLLTPGQMAWHLLWLLGITAATAAFAVLWPRSDPSHRHSLSIHAGAGA